MKIKFTSFKKSFMFKINRTFTGKFFVKLLIFKAILLSYFTKYIQDQLIHPTNENNPLKICSSWILFEVSINKFVQQQSV